MNFSIRGHVVECVQQVFQQSYDSLTLLIKHQGNSLITAARKK